MAPIISIKNITKSYDNGFQALKGASLDIEKGEIIALLGPNGAGKTTLIGAICGLVKITSGTVTVGGFDAVTQPRDARRMIGLVPQEIALDIFETVWNSVKFSRGLFGCRPDDAYLEKVLKSLSLWDKKDEKNQALSGGMKRRVMIAKALSHNPTILFLDEPSAGVDVALRRDMWEVVRKLREDGVTVILTTHYIEEAEEMADRVAVINKGEILLVQDKDALMASFGKKHLVMELNDPLAALPAGLEAYDLSLSENGTQLTYAYDTNAERTGLTRMIAELAERGISVHDLASRENSLEEVFLTLVGDDTLAAQEAKA
ncbi:ABC transporter ATP-binding protein [Celeribacter marinus]|uniref:ABC-type multidrug transport system, ATPase component n=1 Tax=Celeribacter marinus TaxID=1397108 RepID=A0A0N9ZGU9_9RHOB|nr:ABC transporter ATP-binding protein [Celeribacter marinus]ALI55018.1 ABC-type multidrug transport system, ATPase component [Celeribacter marinus]SFK04842.1 ABC-2 type transport system ATP-binding protein [Celeribacter marinus]